MSDNPMQPVGVLTAPLVANADVSDELNRAGVAFGDLVRLTGQAVADTQNRLNATAAASATALAGTLVDVIALQESVYDDQGNLDERVSHTLKLPLVNFIDPVVYQWSQVRLQGLFYAREFAGATEASSSSFTAGGASGQGGFLVILGGGRTTRSSTSIDQTTTTDQTTDVSFGRIRMNAMLQPRRDVSVPKPAQVIQGPRLAIVQGEISDVLEEGVLVARTMSLLIEYHRRNGQAIADKAISIESPGVVWEYAEGSTGRTDAEGRLQLVLRRDFLDEEADRTPLDFIISGRVGMVQATTTVTF